MNEFLYGVVVTLCLVSALYFWRFQRRSQDRFFGLFAGAFALLGFSFILLAAGDRESELRPYLYLIRLAAFLLIIVAFVDKNRANRDAS
jgi:hypothetical protein